RGRNLWGDGIHPSLPGGSPRRKSGRRRSLGGSRRADWPPDSPRKCAGALSGVEGPLVETQRQTHAAGLRKGYAGLRHAEDTDFRGSEKISWCIRFFPRASGRLSSACFFSGLRIQTQETVREPAPSWGRGLDQKRFLI